MERKELTREKANTRQRNHYKAAQRRTPSLTKERSRKKSAEGRIGSPLPIRQRQTSVELRAHSERISHLQLGIPIKTCRQ